MKHYDGLALFSGGLDSLLAARLLMEQGLAIKCLHYWSPFFGSPKRTGHWSETYGLDIDGVDVSEEFTEMLRRGPEHGFGSAMNPCVDCKILMMRRTKTLLAEYGASFIASGEVLGQRPMSQRRDTLNIIRRDADVRGILLRPLCALHLDPTEPELSGLVDRSRLLGFNGRGRKDQLALAERFGITEIPTPGGGCKLTEKENTRRFWPVLRRLNAPSAGDFRLADTGRQFWHGGYWLCIGRHQQDNENFRSLVRDGDLMFKIAGFPGPLAIGRSAAPWTSEEVSLAAGLAASYSPKAVKSFESGGEILVNVTSGGQTSQIRVTPSRSSPFREPSWEDAREELYALRKPGAKNNS